MTWPARYVPDTADNYVSNEIIVAGLTVADVWSCLNSTSVWPIYYSNFSDTFLPTLHDNWQAALVLPQAG